MMTKIKNFIYKTKEEIKDIFLTLGTLSLKQKIILMIVVLVLCKISLKITDKILAKYYDYKQYKSFMKYHHEEDYY